MDEEKNLNNTPRDLDQVLTELQFGPYQMKILILIGLLMTFSNLFPLSFSLTAADLHYRCLVPECETSKSAKAQFMSPWIRDAIPFRDGEPWKCRRFKSLTNVTHYDYEGCPVSFSSDEEENCETFVFASDEVTIVNEFGILCENRRWQLSIIGTINNIGQFLGIPLFGVISDWFGRKSIVIICTLMSTIFGICRGLSTSYSMFAVFEFLDSFFGGPIYPIAFIMGIELVNPKQRSWAVSMIQIFYPFGAIYMGLVGWYFQNWRKILILSYIPGLLFITYFWIIPESVRWLFIKGRHAETKVILKKIAKSNKVDLPEKLFEDQLAFTSFISNKKEEQVIWKNIITAFQTKTVLLRLLGCSWCWFAVNLVYYGVSINAVELVGNKYINFIISSAVEIPGLILSFFMLSKVKRRVSQSSAFIITGLTCILSEFIPPDKMVLKMFMYFSSKLFISTSFSIVYVYTAEIFPTNLRSTLNGITSTLGRIGAMIAPQTILLKFFLGSHAPALIFGNVAICAGILATMFPETFNRKLQDTVDQNEVKDKSAES